MTSGHAESRARCLVTLVSTRSASRPRWGSRRCYRLAPPYFATCRPHGRSRRSSRPRQRCARTAGGFVERSKEGAVLTARLAARGREAEGGSHAVPHASGSTPAERQSPAVPHASGSMPTARHVAKDAVRVLLIDDDELTLE